MLKITFKVLFTMIWIHFFQYVINWILFYGVIFLFFDKKFIYHLNYCFNCCLQCTEFINFNTYCLQEAIIHDVFPNYFILNPWQIILKIIFFVLTINYIMVIFLNKLFFTYLRYNINIFLVFRLFLKVLSF